MYRRHIEQQDEAHEDEDTREQTDPQQDQLPPPLVHAEGDEGHDGVGDEEAEDEAEEVSVVVYPRQQAREEEDCRDPDQLQDRHLRIPAASITSQFGNHACLF